MEKFPPDSAGATPEQMAYRDALIRRLRAWLEADCAAFPTDEVTRGGCMLSAMAVIVGETMGSYAPTRDLLAHGLLGFFWETRQAARDMFERPLPEDQH